MTKILVVEDEETVADAMKAILASEGYEVHVVHDGQAALVTHESLKPELILLDVAMPLKDGITVCREIREKDPRVLILMATAQRVQVNSVMGLDAGADDYIKKPFGLKELLARIKSLLRRLDR